jgi:hypothetical protein
MSRLNKEMPLAFRVEQMQAEIEAYIDAKLAELKASNDGKSLPIESLRQMMTARDRCSCATVLRLSKLD